MTIDVAPRVPFVLCEKVVHGFGRGSRQLGFPTANLNMEMLAQQLTDYPNGVYVGYAFIHCEHTKGVFPMVMNIGLCPTYAAEVPKKTVEIHIMHQVLPDFYGCFIRVVAVKFMRKEQTFGSIDVLRKRIQTDIEEADAYLSSEEARRWTMLKGLVCPVTTPLYLAVDEHQLDIASKLPSACN